mgnify:CR=1 FL=1
MKSKYTSVYNKEYELMHINNKYNMIGNFIDSLFSFLFIALAVFLMNNNYMTIDNFVVIYMYQGRANSLIWNITYFIEILKDFDW